MPRFEVPRVRVGGDLFGTGFASWHDAVLDVYHPSWTVYVQGYRLAADRLVELALSDRSDRDFLIYPILFLYRQFLKLGLKEVIGYVLELTDEGRDRIHKGHRLENLWGDFEGLMAGVNDRSVDTHVAVIKNAVVQFAKVDPTSDVFRYPEKKDGAPVEYPLERVNLPTLRDEMKNTGAAFDMVSGGLSALVDLQRDYRQDMGR